MKTTETVSIKPSPLAGSTRVPRNQHRGVVWIDGMAMRCSWAAGEIVQVNCSQKGRVQT